MADRSVKVTLTLSAEQYKAVVDQAAKATEKLGEAGDKAGKQTQGAMSKMVQSARENREAWTTTGAALLTVGTAITAIGVAALKTGIEYNTLQQTSRAAMTTLLGDAKAASAQMDKLDEFARKSPFSKATFITAQQQMLAFGIETRKVIPYLDAVQQSVAAMGGSNQQISEISFIMSQISAASKITAQDLMQFGQRGINAAELIGSQMGKTGAQIREDITAGTLDADKALDALAAGMQERFGGAADNVKNTITGALDRVKAAWRDMASELAEPFVGKEGGGIFVGLANGAADAMRAFQRLPDPVKATGTALAGIVGVGSLAAGTFLTMAPRVVDTIDAFNKLVPAGSKARNALGGVGRAAGVAGKALGIAAVAYTAAIALDKIANASNGAALGVEEVTAALLAGDHDAVFAQFSQSVTGVGDALDRLLGDSFQAKADRFGSAINNAFGGVLGDVVNDARTAMDQYGQALANLVDGGEVDLAARLFDDLAKAAEAEGYSREQLMSQLGPYREALARIANEQEVAAQSTSNLSGLTSSLTVSLEDAARALNPEPWEAYDKAVEDVTKSVEGAVSTFRDSLGGSSKTMKGWIEDLQRQARAMSEWNANWSTALDQASTEFNGSMSAVATDFVNDMASRGAEGAEKLAMFAQGTPEERAALVQAWADAGAEMADAINRGVSQIEPPTITPGVSTEAGLRTFGDMVLEIGSTTTTTKIDANDAPARMVFDVVTGEWATASTETILAANADPALSIFDVMTGDWAATTTNTKVGADDKPAREYVGGTIGWIDRQYATLKVDADTRAAQSAINRVIYDNDGRKIRIDVNYSAGGMNPYGLGNAGRAMGGPIEGFAGGGAIRGPGTGTSDSILAAGPSGRLLRVSNGEHVLTAAEVLAAGGHDAVYAIRRAIRAGQLRGYAAGGAVQPVYLPSNPAPQVHVSAPSSPAPPVDYERLAAAIVRAQESGPLAVVAEAVAGVSVSSTRWGRQMSGGV